MSFGGAWRGMVGTVKPTKGSGSLEELIRMLPEGIGVLPLFNSIRHGTLQEFGGAIPSYEEKIAELAADGVDLIHPAGTPPFMLLGYEAEKKLIATWEDRWGIPIFTSGSNQVRGMKALGVRRFVGVGYDFEDTSIVHRYFTDAGFEVLGLDRLPGRWEDIGLLSSQEIYRLIKRIFVAYPDAEGIYVQGGKLRMLDIVEDLEQDLGVPVLHPGVSTAWEIMLRLKVHKPRNGYGRLLRELPKG
jgi:maleate cis-trans isomerase